MEQEWGLIGGNIFHGELSAEQLFHMRPAPGYADYRTPIRGLYQCSSATHGGGGVVRDPGVQLRPGDREAIGGPLAGASDGGGREREPSMNDGFTFYFASWYKKSPYFARTVEAGCTSWDLYNHMLIPTLYDDDVTEYWHLLEHVTLWDVAVERQVEIAGPDAARFTQLLTPRDLSTCEVGQCKYVVLCAPDGGIVNDPILLRVERGPVLALARGFRCLAVRARRAGLRRHGCPDPRARRVAAAGAGAEIEAADPQALRRRDRRPPLLPLLGGRAGRDPARRLADGVDGRGRLRAVPPRRDARHGALGPRDERRRGVRIRAIAPSDQRRMEAGIFNYGNDMDVTNNPFEVTGLERLVELGDDNARSSRDRRSSGSLPTASEASSSGSGCGGEPLTMWLEDFWPVTSAGREVGRLTSAAYSPRLRFNMGYAWLPIDLSAMGTRVLAMSPGGPLDAEVVPLPFWDPAKAVPKA